MTYWDTSAVVALLLRERSAETLTSVWDSDVRRVSSRILEAEALTVLRRAAKPGPLDEIAAKRCDQDLDEVLRGMLLVDLDRSVIDALRSTRELADVRSLDAIHLATAVHLHSNAGGSLAVCTLDTRMAVAARTIGFSVLPPAR